MIRLIDPSHVHQEGWTESEALALRARFMGWSAGGPGVQLRAGGGDPHRLVRRALALEPNPERRRHLRLVWAAALPRTAAVPDAVPLVNAAAAEIAEELHVDWVDEIRQELLVTAGVAALESADLAWATRVAELLIEEYRTRPARWLMLALRVLDRQSLQVEPVEPIIDPRPLATYPLGYDSAIDLVEAGYVFGFSPSGVDLGDIHLDSDDPYGLRAKHCSPLLRRAAYRGFRLERGLARARKRPFAQGVAKAWTAQAQHAAATIAVARVDGRAWAGQETGAEDVATVIDSIAATRESLQRSTDLTTGEREAAVVVLLERSVRRFAGHHRFAADLLERRVIKPALRDDDAVCALATARVGVRWGLWGGAAPDVLRPLVPGSTGIRLNSHLALAGAELSSACG